MSNCGTGARKTLAAWPARQKDSFLKARKFKTCMAQVVPVCGGGGGGEGESTFSN